MAPICEKILLMLFKQITTENYSSSTITYCNQCYIFTSSGFKGLKDRVRENPCFLETNLCVQTQKICHCRFLFFLNRNRRQRRIVNKNKKPKQATWIVFFQKRKTKESRMEYFGIYSAIRERIHLSIFADYIFLQRALVYSHLV